MTVMWHAASVTVTNGDDRVVINSNESTTRIQSGAEFNAANFPLRYEVLQVDYDSNLAKYVIVLGKNWGGPSGDVEASVAPSALEMSRAADALEALNESYANIADLLRLTAEPDSIPQRDATGHLKAAPASAADDVVVKSQIGTAANKAVTTSSTDTTANSLLKVADGGVLSTGNAPSIMAGTTIYPTIFGRDGDGVGGYPVFGFASTILNMRYNTNRQSQIGFSHGGEVRAVFRTMVSDNTWSDTFDLFGEHNTNFTVFGGNGADDRVAKATGRGSTTAFLELHLNSPTPPTGVIVTGTFRLVDSVGTTALVNGLGQSSFSLSNAKPSSKLFTVLLSFASASVSKDLPMYLETDSTDAKIEVTF